MNHSVLRITVYQPTFSLFLPPETIATESQARQEIHEAWDDQEEKRGIGRIFSGGRWRWLIGWIQEQRRTLWQSGKMMKAGWKRIQTVISCDLRGSGERRLLVRQVILACHRDCVRKRSRCHRVCTREIALLGSLPPIKYTVVRGYDEVCAWMVSGLCGWAFVGFELSWNY